MKAAVPMAQAAALLDDPRQTWATADYLAPFMSFAQDELVEDVLKIPDIGHLSDTIVLSDVPLDTKSLASYFETGQPLEHLISVVSMKERSITTRTESGWNWMFPQRDITTFQQGPFNIYYAWTGAAIKLPGASQVLDLRVFGKFSTAPIVNADSVIVSGTSPILAAKTAALVAMSRENYAKADRLDARAKGVQDSYLANLMMEVQAVRTRMRPFTGRSVQLN